MLKIVSTVVLILAIVLFPPAALAFASQDAVPGDAMYGVKRTLEDGVLAVASLTPLSKAYFKVALIQRRYNESQKLLSDGKDAKKSLNELVDGSDLAVREIVEVGNLTQRRQLLSDFKTSVKEYKTGLENSRSFINPVASTNNNNSTSGTTSVQPRSNVSAKSTRDQELEEYLRRFEEIDRRIAEADARAAREQEERRRTTQSSPSSSPTQSPTPRGTTSPFNQQAMAQSSPTPTPNGGGLAVSGRDNPQSSPSVTPTALPENRDPWLNLYATISNVVLGGGSTGGNSRGRDTTGPIAEIFPSANTCTIPTGADVCSLQITYSVQNATSAFVTIERDSAPGKIWLFASGKLSDTLTASAIPAAPDNVYFTVYAGTPDNAISLIDSKIRVNGVRQ